MHCMQVTALRLSPMPNMTPPLFLTKDGATPLFLAAQEGHLTVIRQLLSSGAKVNHPREVRGTGTPWQEVTSHPDPFRQISVALIYADLLLESQKV